MKIDPTEALLKDNSRVFIREAKQQDAPQLIECVSNYISDENFSLLTRQEFKPTIVEEAHWIRKFLEEENSLLLVALQGDTIIGNIDVTGTRTLKLRHNGRIGLGMLAAYRNKGLGTHLLQSAINWAQKNSILENLWLDVFASNKAARALYTKMGFIEEGLQKDHIKEPDGTYIDNITMRRKVK